MGKCQAQPRSMHPVSVFDRQGERCKASPMGIEGRKDLLEWLQGDEGISPLHGYHCLKRFESILGAQGAQPASGCMR